MCDMKIVKYILSTNYNIILKEISYLNKKKKMLSNHIKCNNTRLPLLSLPWHLWNQVFMFYTPQSKRWARTMIRLARSAIKWDFPTQQLTLSDLMIKRHISLWSVDHKDLITCGFQTYIFYEIIAFKCV